MAGVTVIDVIIIAISNLIIRSSSKHLLGLDWDGGLDGNDKIVAQLPIKSSSLELNTFDEHQLNVVRVVVVFN